MIARQNTARTFTVGPVLDADGVAVTDCVIADFKVSKNGAAPAALNGSATLTHRHTGYYSLAATASDLDTVGAAEVTIDDTVNACPVKVVTVVEEEVYDILYAVDANLAGNVYGARVWMIDDDAAGTPTDRYVVAFLKNGHPITAGITSPQLQVIKASDGSDLIAATALTQIASTGLYRHDAITTARVADGAAYLAKVTATIDGATRTVPFQPVGRDS